MLLQRLKLPASIVQKAAALLYTGDNLTYWYCKSYYSAFNSACNYDGWRQDLQDQRAFMHLERGSSLDGYGDLDDDAGRLR